MCLSCVSTSLGIVMAGSGDVDCLRIFRELRWRADDGVYGSYGFHFAISMSIGMLFLAGGRASFRTDNLSIGCLLLATSPRFPSRTLDHQYHLQAQRHLYVLAIEWRLLKVIDVDSGEMVSLSVDVVHHDGRVDTIRAPCLLGQLSDIMEIRLPSPTMSPETFKSSCCFYIAAVLRFSKQDSQRRALPILYVKNISNNSAIKTPSQVSDAYRVETNYAAHCSDHSVGLEYLKVGEVSCMFDIVANTSISLTSSENESVKC